MLPIQRIDYGSAHYQQLLRLREAILRTPLGLQFTPEQLSADATDTHFALLEDDAVCGGLILQRVDATHAKLRQIVVAEQHRDIGLGARMLQHVHHYAKSDGFSRLILHAREANIPFYEKQGYYAIGEPFIEVTLPHRRMERGL